MHVAVVSRYPNGGAVGAVSRHQALAFAKRGRASLIGTRQRVELPGVHYQKLPFPRWSLRLGPLEYLSGWMAFERQVGPALEEVHRERPIDFVLTNHVAEARGSLAFGKRHNVPVGLLMQTDIFTRPPGTYDPWTTIWFRRLARQVEREADLIIPLGEPSAADVRARGVEDERIRILANGIDPAEIGLIGEPPEPRRNPSPLRIVSVGRLAVEKGHEVLIEACARARGDFVVDIIGEGDQESNLRRLIARRGLSDRVRLAGAFPAREMASIYTTHDLFVSSAHHEYFGLAILEALTCGLPVIGVNKGGTSVTVQHGVNGLLVPQRDVDAMARAIETLVNDEDLRIRLARNARSSVLPHYSWEGILDRLWGYIEEIVDRNNSRAMTSALHEDESGAAGP
jgi:glycosyltransferase involved in cell wall biosynthesis